MATPFPNSPNFSEWGPAGSWQTLQSGIQQQEGLARQAQASATLLENQVREQDAVNQALASMGKPPPPDAEGKQVSPVDYLEQLGFRMLESGATKTGTEMIAKSTQARQHVAQAQNAEALASLRKAQAEAKDLEEVVNLTSLVTTPESLNTALDMWDSTHPGKHNPLRDMAPEDAMRAVQYLRQNAPTALAATLQRARILHEQTLAANQSNMMKNRDARTRLEEIRTEAYAGRQQQAGRNGSAGEGRAVGSAPVAFEAEAASMLRKAYPDMGKQDLLEATNLLAQQAYSRLIRSRGGIGRTEALASTFNDLRDGNAFVTEQLSRGFSLFGHEITGGKTQTKLADVLPGMGPKPITFPLPEGFDFTNTATYSKLTPGKFYQSPMGFPFTVTKDGKIRVDEAHIPRRRASFKPDQSPNESFPATSDSGME